MERDQFGVWSVTLPPIEGGLPAIPHNSKVKVRLVR
jgi:1,4-alpha-glucan branching enzyme